MTTFDPIDEEFAPAYRASARPVFIVGAPRSGVSLLTLSLGQHQNIVPVLETNWFERAAIGLQHTFTAGITPRETSQLDASGYEINDFSAIIGDTIDRLMLNRAGASATPPDRARWIDGSATLALNIFALFRLFPNAKVIHVLRDVGEVVETFTNELNRPLYKSRFISMTAKNAEATWTQYVTACVDAERAFGSDRITRVLRRTLVSSPETEIRRCLDFIGEPFDESCMRGFRPLEWSPSPASVPPSLPVHQQRSPASTTAELLNRMLMEEGVPSYPGDLLRTIELEIEFGKRCEQEYRLLTRGKQKTESPDRNEGSRPADPIRSTSNPLSADQLLRKFRSKIGSVISGTDQNS